MLQTFKPFAFFSSVILCLATFSNAAMSAPLSFRDLHKAEKGVYELEKTHAYIAISYMHQGYSKPILLFRDFDATLDLKPLKISESALKVNINPASIDSGVKKFDEHLVNADFFDVEKFPEITFVSTAIKSKKDGNYAITGDLTMKGITKPVTLETKFNQGGVHFKSKLPILGFSATGEIKRSDWDLGKYAPMVGDDVSLTIEVEFLKPEK